MLRYTELMFLHWKKTLSILTATIRKFNCRLFYLQRNGCGLENISSRASHFSVITHYFLYRLKKSKLTVAGFRKVMSRRRRRTDAAVLVLAVGEAARRTLIRDTTAAVQRIIPLRMTGRRCGGLRQSTLMQFRVSRVAGGRMLRRQYRDTGCAAATVHSHRQPCAVQSKRHAETCIYNWCI